MEIEDLWDARDKNMPQYELELKRVDSDGELFWRFSARDTSDNYGESIIDVDRKQLKDLHALLELELYPERYFAQKSDEEKYATTDAGIIRHETLAETMRVLDRLMKNLGIPESGIACILDDVERVEFENREGV